MPIGAVLSESSSGENITHYAAIRVRSYGSGNLKMLVASNDDVVVKGLVPFKLLRVNRVIPTRLVNFVSQRASFEFKTTEADEYFRIHRIVIFTKEIYTSFPGYPYV